MKNVLKNTIRKKINLSKKKLIEQPLKILKKINIEKLTNFASSSLIEKYNNFKERALSLKLLYFSISEDDAKFVNFSILIFFKIFKGCSINFFLLKLIFFLIVFFRTFFTNVSHQFSINNNSYRVTKMGST